ncbi:MAG: serine protease [Chloroflexi bacterium]|nr:serine protease [Chloroflexota bacterium]
MSPRLKLATLGVAILVVLGCNLGTPPTPSASTPVRLAGQAPAASHAAEEVPYPAVVEIIAVDRDGNSAWRGSGSIISSDGLILTNAHVVLAPKNFPLGGLVVALTLKPDEPPEPTYLAGVMQADADLDIAVIRVVSDLDGNLIERSSLNLPVVPLGDSDSLKLGDAVTILGYPGIGGETITLTSGEVSGFTAESNVGKRAFIKTSATIAGGNSGGMALNGQGELIGIPTQVGSGGDADIVDCRPLADTNRDGRVDENDTCIPTGGFINALRPVKLAMPLINAAAEGRVMIVEAPSEPARAPTSGDVVFADDFSRASSGWPEDSTEGIQRGYSGGAYQIDVTPDKYLSWAAAPADMPPDVIVSVNVRVLTSTGDSDFGLLCRYQDSRNFYALEISEDRYFSIWKSTDDETVMILDWTQSTDVPSGSDATLSAACIGDRLTLMADGVVLGEATDADLTEGSTGLIAGTWEEGGLRVAFDNFQVRVPGGPGSASGKVLFADDFSDPFSGWPRRSDETVITDYAQGGYRIWVNDSQLDVWGQPGLDVVDAIMEVEATTLGGPQDNDFGVLCRYQDNQNYYLFEISSDGYAIIAMYRAGEWVGLSSDQYQPSDAIAQGEATNRIRAECIGPTLRLYVNDELVAEAEDSTLPSGDVGLIAGTFDEAGTDILFDNFKVSRP